MVHLQEVPAFPGPLQDAHEVLLCLDLDHQPQDVLTIGK